ncbi:MAG TPA: outer membrane beta-barrel protein [Gemmatimonadaceae bacterium]|nr:outer membrane beta-barrel protein [Gemmatimonadaceae bacterium]
MKRTLVFALVAGLVLVSMPASAQLGLKPISLGIAGGGTLPMNDLSDGASTGYNGTLAIALKLPMIPVGLRFDGAYNHFGAKVGDGKIDVASGTANLTYNLPSIVVSPYVIGGAGYYSSLASGGGLANSVRTNDFGWNAGAGIKLPFVVFSAFVEARYNRIMVDGGSVDFLPLTFGIMF